MIDSEIKNNYKVNLNKKSREFLNNLDNFTYKFILNRILSLEKDARPTGSIKLTVHDAYRIRWSDYRILYTIDEKEKVVYIFDIGHRKEIYRKK